MAYLVYIYSQTGPQAQIIHDEVMTEYVRSQGHLQVLKQFPLEPTETMLTIDQLMTRYPFGDITDE